MFSGEFYMLNAVTLGAGLVVLGVVIKPLGRVLATLLYWSLPVGIVLLYDLIKGVRQYMKVDRHIQANDNVQPISKGKGKR